MGCKVSIIVPVFNTKAELLQRCVNSVLNQTYRDFELLIVNDGSCEDTKNELDRIATLDPRIHVIHKPNGGVSSARNAGTALAAGEFIMYVDSDDELGLHSLENACQVAEETDADFIFAAIQNVDYDFEFSPTTEPNDGNYYLYSEDEKISVKRKLMALNDYNYNHVNGIGCVTRGPYSRLIKSDLCKTVKFDESLRIGEDVVWNMNMIDKANKICFVPEIWYCYYNVQGSTLRKYHGDREIVVGKYLERLKAENSEFVKENYDVYIINMARAFYALVKEEYISDNCPLNFFEKKKKLRFILKSPPWQELSKSSNYKFLSKTYRIFITLANVGLGIEAMYLYQLKKKE